MNPLFHPWVLTLGQVVTQPPPGWDDGDATPAAAPARQAPLTMDALQRGMRNWRSEEPGSGAARNWLLLGLAALAVLVLVVQIQQRRRNRKKGALDSEFALFRELTAGVALPWGSTVLLWWVARGSGVSMAALLVSPSLFRDAAATWRQSPTFGLVRNIAQGRVERMERALFG